MRCKQCQTELSPPKSTFCSKKCRDKEYYRKNKERMLSKAAEYTRELDVETKSLYRKKWNEADPVRYKLSKKAEYSNRKAKRLGIEGRLLTADLIELFTSSNWQCNYCDKSLTHDTATLDHIEPLSKGGLNVIENVCVCCASCNKKKASKSAQEFAGAVSLLKN